MLSPPLAVHRSPLRTDPVPNVPWIRFCIVFRAGFFIADVRILCHVSVLNTNLWRVVIFIQGCLCRNARPAVVRGDNVCVYLFGFVYVPLDGLKTVWWRLD